MPTPLSNVLLVFAVTISSVEHSIVYGLTPFLLAFLNETARAWATASTTDEEPS